MSNVRVIRETARDKLKREVKTVKGIARKLQPIKPTHIEKSKKQISRQQQKIKLKKELE